MWAELERDSMSKCWHFKRENVTDSDKSCLICHLLCAVIISATMWSIKEAWWWERKSWSSEAEICRKNEKSVLHKVMMCVIEKVDLAEKKKKSSEIWAETSFLYFVKVMISSCTHLVQCKELQFSDMHLLFAHLLLYIFIYIQNN